MRSTHCFTSTTFCRLARARVLAETLRHHHPYWTLWLCISDVAPLGFDFDIHRENFDHVVYVEALDVALPHAWIFTHDAFGLCRAARGPMLRYIFDRGAERIVYLDPEFAVFNPMTHVESSLERNSVFLTNDFFAEGDAGESNPITRCGGRYVYDIGPVAIRNDREGLRFADWWSARLDEPCDGATSSGRRFDSGPPAFESVAVLQDDGYGVASWNLARRPISITGNGEVHAGSALLRCFFFAESDRVGESLLQRAAGGRSEVFELLRWYRSRLAQSTDAELPVDWWHYDYFEDGTPISRHQRMIWRERQDLQRAFKNPFLSGPDTFQAWYQAADA